MELGITGKTAVVTGASRGIGLAVAEALAAEGVRVVGASRTITPELEKVAASTVAVDLSTRAGAEQLVEHAIAELGGVDFLVNNVGAGDPDTLSLGGFLDVPDEQWEAIFGLNLFSAVWTTRAALPSILERGGAIVNVSSISARVSTGSPVGYAEAKAALTQLGKRLSEELAPRGVRVNTVSPGVVASPLWTDPNGFARKAADALGVTHADLLAGVPEQFGIASGRISTTAEVADLVTFLLSERAANIHGADYVIDGGTLKAA
ncbi:NAD(P)-dependent dehydrogenase (short-subunit alcohol dehydrogenase family) [Kribbella antiqua]|uniref:NAD(P)-dependent dehydrogenase (Short-subunit alcohol dehydrogenase family) n=1 Tax=Kribbella antiqua TaxID=2512217 RepID=A0A4R2ISY2_9ACTN|nr:SDR family oxidoreductase [Kribbella antiqua]TCO48197.1 NAD(P)-dependent dehydrogenase (short-subunit alcohol dehydrogenase family) [Kribbella antiqua]